MLDYSYFETKETKAYYQNMLHVNMPPAYQETVQLMMHWHEYNDRNQLRRAFEVKLSNSKG